MRVRAGVAVAVLAATLCLPGVASADVTPISAQDCARKPGSTQPTQSWAMQRLDVNGVASVNQGLSVGTGRPIKVAVIDSGFDRTNPQLRGVDTATLQDAIPNDPGRRFDDCAGHGTQVTALIAAQHSASAPAFFGIAPQVRIIPIKVTNSEQSVSSADVARAIGLAVDSGAQIANLSLSIGNDPAVEAAVARARRAGMLIVAAAGNDGAQLNPSGQYPAKYSTRYDNVIAVAATNQTDGIAQYSDRGSYVDIAAPGDDVQTLAVNGGYAVVQGTSFATPYVTGTAALVLAENPGMTPAQLRARLESTADSPGVTTPSTSYGYGIVNPFLAVTAVHTDVASNTVAPSVAPVALGPAPAGPDRALQHAALGAGFGLLGLTALVLVGATVLRGRGRARRA